MSLLFLILLLHGRSAEARGAVLLVAKGIVVLPDVMLEAELDLIVVGELEVREVVVAARVLAVLPDFPLHARVPVILYGVVRATRQLRGDLRPLVAHAHVLHQDRTVLLFRPRRLRDRRIQVVVPPLAALLAHATRQIRRDHAPLLRAVPTHQLDDLLILLRSDKKK